MDPAHDVSKDEDILELDTAVYRQQMGGSRGAGAGFVAANGVHFHLEHGMPMEIPLGLPFAGNADELQRELVRNQQERHLQQQVQSNVYQPTEEDVLEYARFLGITEEEDAQLLWIAEQGIVAPLPAPWKACQDEDGEIFYFNFESGESSWDHPSDARFKSMVAEERAKWQPDAVQGEPGARKQGSGDACATLTPDADGAAAGPEVPSAGQALVQTCDAAQRVHLADSASLSCNTMNPLLTPADLPQDTAAASSISDPKTPATTEISSENNLQTQHQEKDPSPRTRGSPQARDENAVLLFDFKSSRACEDPLIVPIAEKAEIDSPRESHPSRVESQQLREEMEQLHSERDALARQLDIKQKDHNTTQSTASKASASSALFQQRVASLLQLLQGESESTSPPQPGPWVTKLVQQASDASAAHSELYAAALCVADRLPASGQCTGADEKDKGDAMLRTRVLELEAQLTLQQEERTALVHRETQLVAGNSLPQAELELAGCAGQPYGGLHHNITEADHEGVVAQLQQQLHEERAKNSTLLVQAVSMGVGEAIRGHKQKDFRDNAEDSDSAELQRQVQELQQKLQESQKENDILLNKATHALVAKESEMQLVIDELQCKLAQSESASYEGALVLRQLEQECERHRAQREELLDKAASALVQKESEMQAQIDRLQRQLEQMEESFTGHTHQVLEHDASSQTKVEVEWERRNAELAEQVLSEMEGRAAAEEQLQQARDELTRARQERQAERSDQSERFAEREAELEARVAQTLAKLREADSAWEVKQTEIQGALAHCEHAAREEAAAMERAMAEQARDWGADRASLQDQLVRVQSDLAEVSERLEAALMATSVAETTARAIAEEKIGMENLVQQLTSEKRHWDAEQTARENDKAKLDVEKLEWERRKVQWERSKEEVDTRRVQLDADQTKLEDHRIELDSEKRDFDHKKDQWEFAKKKFEDERSQWEQERSQWECGKASWEERRNEHEQAQVAWELQKSEWKTAKLAYNKALSSLEVEKLQLAEQARSAADAATLALACERDQCQAARSAWEEEKLQWVSCKGRLEQDQERLRARVLGLEEEMERRDAEQQGYEISKTIWERGQKELEVERSRWKEAELEWTHERSQWDAVHQDAELRKKEWEEERGALMVEIKKLEDGAAAASTQHDELMTKYATEISSLQQDLAEAKLAVHTVEEHRRNAEDMVAKLKANVRELQEQLLERLEKIKRLQEAFENKQSVIVDIEAASESQRSEHSKQIAELESQLAASQNQAKEAVALSELRRSQSEMEIQLLNSSVSESRKDVQQLTSTQEDSARAVARLESLLGNHKQREATQDVALQEMERQLAHTRDALAHANSLKAAAAQQAESAQQRLQDEETERRELHGRVAHLQSKAAALEKEVVRWREAAQALEEQRDSMHMNQEVLSKINEELNKSLELESSEVATLREQSRALAEQLCAQKEVAQGWQTQHKKLQQDAQSAQQVQQERDLALQEHQELQRNLEKRQEDISRLEGQVRALTEDKCTLVEVQGELGRRLLGMEEELASARAHAVETLATERARLVQQHSAELALEREEKVSALASADELEQSMATCRTEMEVQMKMVTSLQEDLEYNKEIRSTLAGDLTAAQAALVEKEEMLEALRLETNQLQSDRAAMEATLEQHAVELLELKEQMEKDSSVQDLALSDKTQLQVSLHAQSQELEQATSRVEELAGCVRDMEGAVEAQSRLAKEATAREAALQQSHDALSRRIEQEQMQNMHLMKEQAVLQGKVMALEEELSALRESREELLRSEQQLVSMDASLSTWKDATRAISARETTLKATVQELEASVRDLRSTNGTLQAQLHTLTQFQNAEKSKLARVSQQYKQLTTDHGTLQESYKSNEEKLEQEIQNRNETRRLNQQLKEDLEEKNAQLVEVVKRDEQLKATSTTLASSLVRERKETESLRASMRALEAAQAAAAQQLREERDDKRNLLEKFVEREKELVMETERLQAQLGALQAHAQQQPPATISSPNATHSVAEDLHAHMTYFKPKGVSHLVYHPSHMLHSETTTRGSTGPTLGFNPLALPLSYVRRHNSSANSSPLGHDANSVNLQGGNGTQHDFGTSSPSHSSEYFHKLESTIAVQDSSPSPGAQPRSTPALPANQRDPSSPTPLHHRPVVSRERDVSAQRVRDLEALLRLEVEQKLQLQEQHAVLTLRSVKLAAALHDERETLLAQLRDRDSALHQVSTRERGELEAKECELNQWAAKMEATARSQLHQKETLLKQREAELASMSLQNHRLQERVSAVMSSLSQLVAGSPNIVNMKPASPTPHHLSTTPPHPHSQGHPVSSVAVGMIEPPNARPLQSWPPNALPIAGPLNMVSRYASAASTSCPEELFAGSNEMLQTPTRNSEHCPFDSAWQHSSALRGASRTHGVEANTTTDFQDSQHDATSQGKYEGQEVFRGATSMALAYPFAQSSTDRQQGHAHPYAVNAAVSPGALSTEASSGTPSNEYRCMTTPTPSPLSFEEEKARFLAAVTNRITTTTEGTFPGNASSIGIQQRAQVQVMEEAWDLVEQLKSKLSQSEGSLVHSRSNFTKYPHTAQRNTSQAGMEHAANRGKPIHGSAELKKHGRHDESQKCLRSKDGGLSPNIKENMGNTECDGSVDRDTAGFTPLGALVAALAAVRAAGTTVL